MRVLLQILLSATLIVNPTSQARAQSLGQSTSGPSYGLNEVAQTWQKAATYGEMLATLQGSNHRLFSFVQKKISRFKNEKLPKIMIKAPNEIELQLAGVIAIVKIPEPYAGVVLVNSREIDMREMSEPDKFFQSIRKALPKKTAQLFFEYFFPSAEASNDVMPTRVQPGQINAPAGAQVQTGGVIHPAYSPGTIPPATQPAMAPPVPKAAASGGMNLGPLMMGLGIVMMLMSFFGKGECKDVDKRKEKCDQLEQKALQNENVTTEARELATEMRSDSRDNQCSGARGKLVDCMQTLKAVVHRKFGGDIGEIKAPAPPGSPLSPTTRK